MTEEEINQWSLQQAAGLPKRISSYDRNDPSNTYMQGWNRQDPSIPSFLKEEEKLKTDAFNHKKAAKQTGVFILCLITLTPALLLLIAVTTRLDIREILAVLAGIFLSLLIFMYHKSGR